MALIGFGLIAFFVLVAMFAPWIAPYEPTDFPGQGTVTPTNIPGPSAEHWFGLDQLGRDEFSRVVYGARQSLLVGVGGDCCSVCRVASPSWDLLAGAFGGWVDSVIMRLCRHHAVPSPAC